MIKKVNENFFSGSSKKDKSFHEDYLDNNSEYYMENSERKNSSSFFKDKWSPKSNTPTNPGFIIANHKKNFAKVKVSFAQNDGPSKNLLLPGDDTVPPSPASKNKVQQSSFNHSSNMFNTEVSDVKYPEKISENDIILNSKLLIKEIEGNQLRGDVIIINCAGMLNGKRNKKDGLAVFGISYDETVGEVDQELKKDPHYASGNYNLNIHTHSNNDFTFFTKSNLFKPPSISKSTQNVNHFLSFFSIGQKKIEKPTPQKKHLFFIYYCPEKKSYFVRVCGSSSNKQDNPNLNEMKGPLPSVFYTSIFFVKINSCYILEEKKNIVMLGEVLFIIMTQKDKVKIIKPKPKDSNNQNNMKKMSQKSLNQEEQNDQIIEFQHQPNQKFTIGRKDNCDVSMPSEKSLSKIHATLSYDDKMNHWILTDGCSDQRSKNGIWLSPQKSFKIYDHLQFKIVGITKCEISIKD